MRQKFSFNKLLGIILIVLLLASCKQKENHKTQETENAPLSELTQLIRENPDDINLYVERAKLYYEEEAYDEAIDDVVKAQNIDSLRTDLYHLLADIYLDYYKSYEALKTMEKVVSLHPERIPSLLKLAEFQYILKQYNESVNTCNEILAVDRLEPEAYFMLGMNFRALDDIERAKNAFQTAVENNPELIDAWLMLGSIHEYQGDSTAMLYYDNALLIAPESIEALHAKAFYLQNNDRIPEAIGIYKQIIGIDPQYTDAYLNTGLLYLELDSLGQAYEQFNILIGIDVTNPLAYFYRGYTFEQGGEINKARADYEQALRLSPDFEEARNALKLLSDEES
jgi:tetratricopeptide (TPR) repeat protein